MVDCRGDRGAISSAFVSPIGATARRFASPLFVPAIGRCAIGGERAEAIRGEGAIVSPYHISPLAQYTRHRYGANMEESGRIIRHSPCENQYRLAGEIAFQFEFAPSSAPILQSPIGRGETPVNGECNVECFRVEISLRASTTIGLSNERN